MNPCRVEYRDLGTVDYKRCWDLQSSLFDALIDRKQGGSEVVRGTILLCEHPHVYTLGRSGNEGNMLISEQKAAEQGASFYRIDRGGDITYHGPGQLVGYPILDLERFGLGLKGYINLLEQSLIELLAHYDIKGRRMTGATGVWLDKDERGGERKIAAIGVRSSRFVTMHGFSLNVDPQMEYFSHINPCGFVDKGVTSIYAETGSSVEIGEVKKLYLSIFEKLFGAELFSEQENSLS